MVKHLIRYFSIWLIDKTSAWVVPPSIYRLVDDKKIDEILVRLKEIEKVWPNDPEITRTREFVSFMWGVDEVRKYADISYPK